METLLLGRGGRVLSVLPWKRAITLTYCRNDGSSVFPLEFHDDVIRTKDYEFQLPSVLMLLGNKDRYPNFDCMTLTRENIFLRDDYECQWCGKKLTGSSATIDHLYPSCKGGTHSWRNVVTSCMPCNNEKGKMTREEYEARKGIKLRSKPITPSRGVMFKKYTDRYETWSQYIK